MYELLVCRKQFLVCVIVSIERVNIHKHSGDYHICNFLCVYVV